MPAWIEQTLAEAKQRQVRYWELRATGLSKRDAARAAGYRGSRISSPKLIETPEMRAHLQSAMLHHGGTPAKIAQTVVGALDAYTERDDGSQVPDFKAQMMAARVAKELVAPEDKTQSMLAHTLNIILPTSLAGDFASFAPSPKTIEGESK